jgi:CheY-like chemotaxis protein
MMPDMDGLTATTRIRALPGPAGRTPILGLTANALRADEAACIAAGMDHFATKPINAERLEQALGEAMLRARASHAAETPAAADDLVDDDGALARLELDLGREPAVDLVRLFVETAPRQLASLQSLAAKGQESERARQAHTLASVARSMGLHRLARACRDLERADAGAADRAAASLETLAGLLEQGVAALRRWLAGSA